MASAGLITARGKTVWNCGETLTRIAGTKALIILGETPSHVSDAELLGYFTVS